MDYYYGLEVGEKMTVIETVPPEETTILVSDFQGGALTTVIRSMVGTPPEGFEYIEYAVGAAIFMILFALIASVIVGFSKMFGAK